MTAAVLIPSYNAANTLAEVIERTAVHIPYEHIIVVNDGSTDGTDSVAKKYGVVVLTHERNRGKGAALRTGFTYVKSQKIDCVITLDADQQHQPEEIPQMLKKKLETGCDIIIGSRLHHLQGMPFHRILSNTITTALVRLRTGADISDSQSGYRCIDRTVLEKISFYADGFEAETEFIIAAASKGCTFDSIPIKTIYAGEKSHMKNIHTTVQFIKVLLKQY